MVRSVENCLGFCDLARGHHGNEHWFDTIGCDSSFPLWAATLPQKLTSHSVKIRHGGSRLDAKFAPLGTVLVGWIHCCLALVTLSKSRLLRDFQLATNTYCENLPVRPGRMGNHEWPNTSPGCHQLPMKKSAPVQPCRHATKELVSIPGSCCGCVAQAVDDRFKLLLGIRLSLVDIRQIQRQDGGHTNIDGMSLLKLRRYSCLASKFATSDGVKDRLTGHVLHMWKENLVALSSGLRVRWVILPHPFACKRWSIG